MSPTTEPTADEIEALRHQLVRLFEGLHKPANHIVAATCFLMGIQGRHGGKVTMAQVQAVACAYIERGWKAYDSWSVVDMPRELPAPCPHDNVTDGRCHRCDASSEQINRDIAAREGA